MTTLLKPKRIRRTKAQMANARVVAAANAELDATLEARIALASPQQLKQAERTLAYWKRQAARY